MICSLLWFSLLSFSTVAFSPNSNENFKIKNDVKEVNGNPLNSNFKSEQSFYKSKTEFMAQVFRKKVEDIKSHNETELIILVDGSSSIGNVNFQSEMKYIHKVISDVDLGPKAVRLAVIIYSSGVVTYVNHLKLEAEEHEKCSLLHYHLPSINYTGGNTNTRDALLEAERIFSLARPNAQKIIFLVTDGFSNKGDPIPVADRLKRHFVNIYTFGIENGNVEELRQTASRPITEHSYLFKSFDEFEGFERRALHQDLKPGIYAAVSNSSLCNLLCENPGEYGCCNEDAKCSCGKLSGHFACLCPPGYYGSGLRNEECKQCPNGTYSDGTVPGDGLVCFPCPDRNHITLKAPATSKADCSCVEGYVPDGDRCKMITCPELSPPNNGYFVKKTCSNVLNAACGIRCETGFTLSGSSVRICQKNATWSGIPPFCQSKRCEQLKPVPNSEVICVNEEDNFEVVIRYNSTGGKIKNFVKWLDLKKDENGTLRKPIKLQEFDISTNKTNELNYTVDTECTYTCLPGYFLVGSKSRSCLPMLRWSGLKTTCKAIKCHSLQKIENGTVAPENCTTKGLKHYFGETCNYTCNAGYDLKGPKTTNCTGRHGTWSGKNNPTKCIDVEPPKLLCPSNLTVPTDEGVHFATLSISLPNATDNSGKEPVVWSKPPLEKDYPLRFIIGVSDVEIYSVDHSGNYAFCSFKVFVKDVENPKILECESPPIFFTNEFPPNSTEIKWKEPVVDDNSGVPIPITRNPSISEFPLGITPIVYTATDSSGNNASCSLNITILENPCSERPEITNTLWHCTNELNLLMCNVTCSKGFAFASSSSSKNLTLNCTYSGRKASWSPDLFHGDMDLFPECSETETPTEIEGEIVIDATEELCNELEDLSNEIAVALEGEELPIFATCEDEPSEEEIKQKEELEEDTNVIRKKRSSKKKKLRIGFAVKAVSENGSSSEELVKDLNNTKEKVKKFYAKHRESNLSGVEKDLAMSTNVRLKCRNGSLLKESICVKCPKGTFHNAANSTCEPCPIGQYQEVEGQVTCSSCPEGYSTRKIRRRHPKQCKKICPPGSYGKKKTKAGLALAPCYACPKGQFQPLRGQTFCEKCLDDFTTLKRGSNDSSKCFKKSELEDLCFKFNCRNGGTCFVSEGFAICKCPPGFLGAFCERRFNPCGFSPCYNSGECVATSAVDYICKCPGGFEGVHCEREVNECLSNPCGINGECIDLFDAYRCSCFSGFRGENCSERISLCEELEPCQNSGSCIDVSTSFKCICTEGYTGALCDEPLSLTNDTVDVEITPEISTDNPCWNISCNQNAKCVLQWNHQPLCVCTEGFRGENCTQAINPRVVLHFPKYGVTEYLAADLPQLNLTEISICLWIKTKDDFNYGTLFSYSTFHDDNAFTLTDYSGLVLYASGSHVVTDLIANDGLWHFICVTWQSNKGNWKIYVDGSIHTSGIDLSSNVAIPGGGKLVVGQEQDFFGGGFNELESFSGRLTFFDVWDRVLQPTEIKNLYESCDEISGNLVSWSQLLQNIHGSVLEEESIFCKKCKENLTLFRGQISYDQTGETFRAIYQCDEGFFLHFHTKESEILDVNSWGRKCMKYGEWEWKEPKCNRVSCGFPGYLLSGMILGKSYLYGDVIEYRCEKEYILEGNGTRVCQANGSWSGQAPICQGNSNNCKKLVAPRHGSMFVYFNQGRSYGSALPSIGDRIEFTCDVGYNLKGFGMLTCLNGGIWDREQPVCEEIKCQFPKEASHLIDLNIPRTASFYFRDSLTITCVSGVRKIITCGEFGAWNFTSNTCGNKCFERPRNPVNGYVLDDGRYNSFFEENEILFVKCKPGFILLGDNLLNCSKNGTWIQSKPTFCDPLNCGPPPRPPHPYFIAHEEGHYFSQRTFLDCAPGYQKTGDIITRCGMDGRWTRIQNTCIKISCFKPTLPKGFLAENEQPNYFYLDKIRVKCPVGKSLTNPSIDFITCQSNGQWSKIPECY